VQWIHTALVLIDAAGSESAEASAGECQERRLQRRLQKVEAAPVTAWQMHAVQHTDDDTHGTAEGSDENSERMRDDRSKKNNKQFDCKERRWLGLQRSAINTALPAEHNAAIDE